jgi:predicted RNase H-like HicB family nuclease
MGGSRAKIVRVKRRFSAAVWREGDWFVSQCLDVDVASQGRTKEEALENLREALELYFELSLATHPPQVRHIEVEVGAARSAQLPRDQASSGIRGFQQAGQKESHVKFAML